MDYEQLVTVMRRLSIEAGDKIMEIYGADDFEVKTKSDESPVTIADEAADKIISDGLRAAFPDVMLVTEEQSATHSASGDTFLIVDPLDGTKEFINRRGDFCLCPRPFAHVLHAGRWQRGRGNWRFPKRQHGPCAADISLYAG